MVCFNKSNIKDFFSHIKSEGVSMRRRFAIYITSTIALILSVILLLMNLLGIMNPTNDKIMDALDTQLLSYSDNIEQDYDRIAAYAISFSDQLESAIQNFLTENNLSFVDLKNNTDALTQLQSELYATVYLNMQMAPSSGAFYILDTTVNSQSEEALYNGIYLKYINLYSENTVNNEIALFRGSFATGKNNNLVFHSGWNNEMRTDFFVNCDSVFSGGTHYVLSPTVDIPDTWEHARYVYVPIRDLKENIIGICGYEVNDLYFQLSKKSNDSKCGQIIGALLDEKDGVYSGQFNSNGFNAGKASSVILTQNDKSVTFDFGSEKYIGKTKTITLGNSTFTVALMIAEAQYEDALHQGQAKIAGIILFIVVFSFLCCVVMSKKYVAPILKKIDQVKTKEDDGVQLKIREIDELFTFLAEKDNFYEAQLKDLQAAKQAAEEEATRTKEAYDRALEAYNLSPNKLFHASDGKKKEVMLEYLGTEITQEDCDYFICGLKTLTPTERRIYDLYLDGLTLPEIADILGIKENTMKFHNKNIYSKLGVSSRKQLIKVAVLIQYRDKKGTQSNDA